MSLLLDVFGNIADSFAKFAQKLGFDAMLYIIAALLGVTIILAIIVATSSYERNAAKRLKEMNAYFKANPEINDGNLVEFNSRMKRMPKEIRTEWQQYMINRDKKPSEFINETNCIDKAIRGSRYSIATTLVLLWVTALTIFSLIVGMGFYYNATSLADATTSLDFSMVLFTSFMIPAFTAIIGIIITMILRGSQRRAIKSLADNFVEFSTSMEKACKTLPEYIDYEILFTEKEIREEIPALKVYLDKKAEMERKLAEENAAEEEFETYDFEELGLDNAILLERAMKEGERFIKARNTLQNRIKDKEDEMFNYARNFEDVTKTFEKKAQVVREAIDQLNAQINATTVAVEANYFRNRQIKEEEKLQIAESEYEAAKQKFDKQQGLIQKEIDTYYNEIDKRKANLEEAMKAECKTYANKIYGELARTVREQNAPFLQKLEAEKRTLMDQVSGLTVKVEETEKELEDKTSQLNRLEDSYKVKTAEIEAMQNVKDYFTSAAFIENLSGVKEREGRAQRMEEENQKVREQIAALEKEKAEINVQIQRERELIQKQAEDYRQRALKADAAVRDTQEQMKFNEEGVQKRLHELELREREISTRAEQLKENATKLKDTVGVLSELKEELLQKEKAIEEKQAELREVTAQLEQAKVDVENTHRELENSKRDLEKTQKLSEERKERLKKLRAMTDSIEKENMELNKKQRELKTSINEEINKAEKTFVEEEPKLQKVKPLDGVDNVPEVKARRRGANINSSLNTLLEKASKKKEQDEK